MRLPFGWTLDDCGRGALAIALGAAAIGAQFVLAGPPREITGRAEAISGDSLLIEDAYMRLDGVDAPAFAQTCLDARGVRHEVGRIAAARLAQLVYPGDVSCRSSPGHAGQGVFVAACAAGGEDLGGRIIAEGWAWPVSSTGGYSSAHGAPEPRAPETAGYVD